jgi:hypothetical protein
LLSLRNVGLNDPGALLSLRNVGLSDPGALLTLRNVGLNDPGALLTLRNVGLKDPGAPGCLTSATVSESPWPLAAGVARGATQVLKIAHDLVTSRAHSVPLTSALTKRGVRSRRNKQPAAQLRGLPRFGSTDSRGRKEMSKPVSTRKMSSEAALAEQLVAGTQKYLSAVSQITLEGSTFTPSQLEAQLNAFADLRNAVDAAKATVKAKLLDERMKAPALRAIFLAFIGFVRVTFGNQPEVLAGFGLAPKKEKKALTTEQQAAAKAKREATRKARGTVGKKKKLAIKGDVTGVVVTPITEPKPANGAPSAPSATPSGAAR